ncbi:unnamed protein product, partial [Prorocentrum cordatum]
QRRISGAALARGRDRSPAPAAAATAPLVRGGREGPSLRARIRIGRTTLLRAAEEPGGKRRALHAPTALGEALRRAEKRGREGREGGRGREERRGRREVEDQEAALDAVASAIKIPGRGPSAPAPLYTQDSGYKNIHGRTQGRRASVKNMMPLDGQTEEHSRAPFPGCVQDIQQARRTLGHPPRVDLDLLPRSDRTWQGDAKGSTQPAAHPWASATNGNDKY